MGNYEIDLVLPWVDGSDLEWQRCKKLYQTNNLVDAREERYRDWGLLKYVFRGIEKNLPWVRKVHFITYGHLPNWLNVDCEVLHIVKHTDYIPKEYLPTFSANPIELNIHRIEGLADHFIYTNDDIFYVKEIPPTFFFENGIPCSQAGLSIRNESDSVFNGILFENRKIINRHFFSKDVMRQQLGKFINFRYKLKDNYKSLLLLPFCVGYFPSLSYFHGPNAYLKSTFKKVWEAESAVLNETCNHKFRQFNDVNQYLFMWWQWCEGNFAPKNMQGELKYINTSKNTDELISVLQNCNEPLLCINDAKTDEFKEKKEALIDAFEKVFPEKSKFEI